MEIFINKVSLFQIIRFYETGGAFINYVRWFTLEHSRCFLTTFRNRFKEWQLMTSPQLRIFINQSFCAAIFCFIGFLICWSFFQLHHFWIPPSQDFFDGYWKNKFAPINKFDAMADADGELARILTKITFRGLTTACVITDDEYKVIKWVFWGETWIW